MHYLNHSSQCRSFYGIEVLRGLLGVQVVVISAIACLGANAIAKADELDSSWTLTVNGQSVQVNPDGSFYIPNVSAPDADADYLSDSRLLVYGIRTVAGTTEYVYSDPFYIERMCPNPPCAPAETQPITRVIDNLNYSLSPPPFADTINVMVDGALLSVGESRTVLVAGTIIGSQDSHDLTTSCAGTTYRVSNPSTLFVEEVGDCVQSPGTTIVRVTGVSPGIAFLTATNNGATSVKRFDVFTLSTTTIEGLVRLPSGSPVQGALVTTLPSLGESATTDASGRFSIEATSTECESGITVRARAVSGLEEGESGLVQLIASWITDVGIIVVDSSPLAACCQQEGFECENLTHADCDLEGGFWERGYLCDVGAQSCPSDVCITATNPCNVVALGDVGCNYYPCCEQVCYWDHYCCAVAWDQNCVNSAQNLCGVTSDFLSDAPLIPCGGHSVIDTSFATTSPNDPVFGCFGLFPGAQGMATSWAAFVADGSEALIGTCSVLSTGGDSILAVYSGGCGELMVELACSDDAPSCLGGYSEVCVTGLNQGEVYYIQLAIPSEDYRGFYNITVECSCP